MKASYTFDEQFEVGKRGAKELDAFFSHFYNIKPATREQERRGIDRVFTCPRRNETWTVEYKTDTKTALTLNAFIETISVDDSQGQRAKQGWIYTTQADYLVYYIPQWGQAYLFQPPLLLQSLETWANHFPQVQSQNPKYQTHGVLVPLREVEQVALKTLTIRSKHLD